MYNSMINNKHVFRNHALNESNVKGGARLLTGSVMPPLLPPLYGHTVRFGGSETAVFSTLVSSKYGSTKQHTEARKTTS